MSHFYELTENREVSFLPDVKTQPQANKADGLVVKSVTTMLKLLPNDFLQSWMNEQFYKLGKEGVDLETSRSRVWGTRLHPETGELVSSSDWGTELHKEMELAAAAYKEGADYHNVNWQGWTRLWVDWLIKNDVTVKGLELYVGCANRMLAGSIDFLGVKDGKYFLADFKSRSVTKGSIKSKAYEKDACQLAIEAAIIKEQYRLDYMPRIYTIIVNTDKFEIHPHLWTPAAQAKALLRAEAANTFYNVYHLLT